jgi:acetyl-CoA carboxylase biotin carboxylase subunit
MFEKILIANRGEIAVRVIRACREMGIKSVAIYSEADANSLHARLADESVCVGPGPNQESYMNIGNVLMAAMVTGAEAIHPGYAYFSEQSQFAEACASSNIKFIGPSPKAIGLMGEKAKAREVVSAAGAPVIPGTDGVVLNEQEAVKEANKIGYPILVKASAGGGGRGIRRVDAEEELPKALRLAQQEALSCFGDGDVYLEKCLVDPRHVEIQILADEHGNTIYLGERECSIQNMRHQKIIEEAPAVGMTTELRKRMGEAAVKAARAVNYANAGTVEFLLDSTGDFYFLEMNTRLQVEHPVTEMVTGLDLVKLQIRVAFGETLPLVQEDIKLNGHAIEVRINAVDPDNEFAPSAGRINEWIEPGGPGIRIDSYVYAGYEVPPYYDAMIAKMIVHAEDRPAAIARLRRALREFVVTGIKTNLPFLRQLVEVEDYIQGNLSTGLVGRLFKNGNNGSIAVRS